MHRHTLNPTLDPSPEASVVLTIGGHLGAMVLYTRADETGREIEISPTGDDRSRTHAAVRQRHGDVFCVVYDALPAGDYTLWEDPATPAGTATVEGGRITEVDWTERPSQGG